MYELNMLTEKCGYIQSPAKAGLVRLNETDVCLIDSGSDKDAGRKIRQILDANGWHLMAIYNTHSHADHIGGNRYLQNQTGCRIYAPGVECAFTRHTVLEPAGLYGGWPGKDLRHKFLMAQESDAAYLTPEVLPEGMEMLPLPGHSFDMTGFRTADGVAYIADCLSSRQTLDKYRVGYVWDVGAYLDTLERVKTMDATVFVPAHAEVTEDIAPLAQVNIDAVHAVAEDILDVCRTPSSAEAVLRALFDKYELVMTFEQHALVGSTVRSYLAWLKDTGRVNAGFEDNTMVWERVG